MGKRKAKAKKPQGPKRNAPLPTTFSCLFCNHDASVSVKMDKKAGTGELSCKVCGQQFQTGINYLSAAVDVYSDWVDACDEVAKDTAGRDVDAGLAAGVGGRRNSDIQFESNLVAAGDEDDDKNGADYGD